MKIVITILFTVQTLIGCSTLTPIDPVKTVEKMSTYQLQNEYLELEHEINELESEFNNLQSSTSSNVNFQFYNNSAVWIAIALNVLNAYNLENLVTRIEKHRSRLSDIELELSRRGMY